MSVSTVESGTAPPGRGDLRWAMARERVAVYLVAAGLEPAAADETAAGVVARVAERAVPDSTDEAILAALVEMRRELAEAGRATELGALTPSSRPVAIRRQSLLPALRWRRGRWLPRPVLIRRETKSGASRAARQTLPAAKLDVEARRRRTIFTALILATTVWGVYSLAEILGSDGLSAFELVYLGVFSLLMVWLSQSFWTLAAGFAVLLRAWWQGAPEIAARPDPSEAAGRIAIVMPIYNEGTGRVFAGLEAMWRDLRRAAPEDRRCDLFVLSDTTDPDVWLAEIEAWRRMRLSVGDTDRIFYRRRERNVGKKTGNIEDFLTRWGSNYAYMVVLDADSLMTGRSILELIRRMDEHPEVGLIQAPPKLVRGRTLFARVLQYAGELYGPLAATGTGYWARGEGNYWGHNAIIRVRPFIELCGLPHLPGKAPFGGQILSHDFVEAALLRRGGWQLWIASDLEGSYEEPPPSVEDFAVRDRRWCQGNLQHIRVLFARHLHWVSRLHLGIGIMSYLTSPLWLIFLVLSAMQAWTLTHEQPVYFAEGWPFPMLPVSKKTEATILLTITLGLLFLPKLLGLFLALVDRSRRQALGGAARIVAGAVVETLYSALIAPIMMLMHTWFVTSIVLGGAIDWKPQRREVKGGQLAAAVRGFGWVTAIGIVAAVAAWRETPMLFYWLIPVLAGLVFAIPLVMLGASESLGQGLARLGILTIREEALPPAVMWDLDAAEGDEPAGASRSRFIRAVLEPQANALHVQLLRALRLAPPPPPAKDRWLLERKAVYLGPGTLDKAERRAVLEDPEFMERLHLLAWVHWPAYLPGILDALREGVEPGSPEPSDPEHRPGGPVPAVA